MLSVAERHKYILDHLNKYGFVRITDVANELGVTKVTIRKDVKILDSTSSRSSRSTSRIPSSIRRRSPSCSVPKASWPAR